MDILFKVNEYLMDNIFRINCEIEKKEKKPKRNEKPKTKKISGTVALYIICIIVMVNEIFFDLKFKVFSIIW